MPKLSVITINYNNVNGLKKTIDSVLAQSCTLYEYIIVDGGSTDDSTLILDHNKQHLKYWVSEKDNGIYHAMNKGIDKAEGEYLIFLNSGDTFADSTVLTDFCQANLQADIIYGNLKFSDNRQWILPAEITFDYLFHNALAHPALFTKKSVFATAGYFNEELQIVSDWLLYTRAFIQYNASQAYFNRLVAVFDETGISSINRKAAEEERRQCLEQYFPLLVKDYGELDILKKETGRFRQSRLANWALKLQQTRMYKFLRSG